MLTRAFIVLLLTSCEAFRMRPIASMRSAQQLSLAAKSSLGRTNDSSSDFSGIMMFKTNATPWRLSDSMNSTTLRALLTIQEEITSFWVKIEKQIASLFITVDSKIQRDLRTTAGVSDYVARKLTKDMLRVFEGMEGMRSPLLGLPSKISSDSWDLLRAGINPLEGSRLYGSLEATSTKQRSEKLKQKRRKNMLTLPLPSAGATGSADALYRTIRVLPNTIKYDYERQKISKELRKESRRSPQSVEGMLPSGSERPIATETETERDIEGETERQKKLTSFEVMQIDQKENLKTVGYEIDVEVVAVKSAESLSVSHRNLQATEAVASALSALQLSLQTDFVGETCRQYAEVLSACSRVNLVALVDSLDTLRGSSGVIAFVARLNALLGTTGASVQCVQEAYDCCQQLEGAGMLLSTQAALTELCSSSSATGSERTLRWLAGDVVRVQDAMACIAKGNRAVSTLIEQLKLATDLLVSTKAGAAEDARSKILREFSLSQSDVRTLEIVATDAEESLRSLSEETEAMSTPGEEIASMDFIRASLARELESALNALSVQKVSESADLWTSPLIAAEGELIAGSVSANNENFEYSFGEDLGSNPSVESSEGSQVSGVVFETTADTSDSVGVVWTKRVLYTADITFFLLESLVMAVIPLVRDGGKQAAERIVATYDVLRLFDTYSRLSSKPRKTTSSMNSKWVRYDQFK